MFVLCLSYLYCLRYLYVISLYLAIVIPVGGEELESRPMYFLSNYLPLSYVYMIFIHILCYRHCCNHTCRIPSNIRIIIQVMCYFYRSLTNPIHNTTTYRATLTVEEITLTTKNTVTTNFVTMVTVNTSSQ